MTVTQGSQYDENPGSDEVIQTPSGPVPRIPAAHVPLIQRIEALEQWAAVLAGKHDQLAADVIRELGL